MATSIVVRSMSFLSVAVLVGFSTLVSGQSVAPSNATLPTSESGFETVLRLSPGPILTETDYNIAPLTTGMGKGTNQVTVQSISISGPFKLTDYTNVGNLSTSEIAFISCDPNGSNIDPSTVVGSAGDARPAAIVLYSLTAQECSLNGSYGYNSIFSMTSLKDSASVMSTVAIFPSQTNILMAAIAANTTSSSSPTAATSTSNDGGPAPTTAVAMSILYSITGIITLLFLIIIATGAIRAHRHPERYGPRNGYAGRPRQSRAKGLARAMLETLPIVKFGDPEPLKPGSRDVELESGHSTANPPASTTATLAPATAPTDGATPSPTEEAVESGLGAAQAGSIKSGQEAAVQEGELGCSICTEDFKTGEDVRVLPCQHKYHPACIDPWLLNVSGTCPLCRHDLRPVTSNTSNPEGSPNNAEGDELPPPLSLNEGAEANAEATEEGEAGNHQRRRMSRFLDLNRLRHAPPDERIAALRQLREETQRDEEQPAEEVEERSRRARITGRLRDTFRIRTRTQNPTPEESSSSA